uniref:Uncharacterized protein n=1 Tax=Globisporangium ultimum (strain ATCC 200006 / CBS 805.95 / DAOM BR144) TaxID=431595 RepID=K3WWZ7_GLOUD
MSEDEFVVLLEHAGLTEVSDDGGQEFVEKSLLLGWLVREGIELFGAAFLRQQSEKRDDDAAAASDNDNGALENANGIVLLDTDALAASGTNSRATLAQRILERLVECEWLSPIEFDYDEQETEEWKATLYGLRLSTADAYRIYIGKDSA